MSPRKTDRMSDGAYQLMVITFNLVDFFMPHIGKRVMGFGLRPGMTVVDYGCGPGRYTVYFSKLVGQQGKVYAVDIHATAIAIVEKKKARLGLANVEPMLAKGYDSGLAEHIADVVTAIDMFFGVREPAVFLAELRRILKPGGILVIDDGHQPRHVTKEKIAAAGGWKILEETRDHLKCVPA